MPPTPSKQSSAAPTALVYITLGALLTVWSAIWFFYRVQTQNTTGPGHYICLGLLLTGVALLVIGFGVGQISRKAQAGELEAQQQAAKASAMANDQAKMI